MREILLLKHQWDFVNSKVNNLLLVGGIGSGKTYTGCIYTLKTIRTHPKALGGIFANTYKQLLNSTLAALFKELNDFGIPYDYNQNRGILTVANAKIICSSLENYDALRGIELGWFWMDEGAYSTREAFEMLLGRLRDKNGPLECRITTTPKGYNWLFDYFDPSGDMNNENFNIIKAKTTDNKHLPDSYYQTLVSNYDEKLAKQELEGEFVNTTSGKIYWAFDREKHIKPVRLNKTYPVYVGMDFNVNPMTAVITQFYNGKMYVVSEMYLKNSNTFDMAIKLKQSIGVDNITIIPDSTGSKNTTNSTKSDHAILKEAGFKDVKQGKNPYRVDRYNAVNASFDKLRIEIDPSCTWLIKDLEQVTFKEGSDQPDTANKMLTHISDALGYAVYNFMPLRPFDYSSAKITMY